MKTGRYLLSLQSLRAIFMLLIVLSHYPFSQGSFDFGGDCGVAFFFILSGFVMTYATACRDGEPEKYGEYLKRKARRLYPANSLFLLMALVLSARELDGSSVVKFVLDLLLLQSWVPSNDYNYSFNGVAWFLSTLAFIYLLAPMIISRILKWNRRRLVALLAGLLLAVVVYGWWVRATPTTYWFYVFPPFRVVDFILGTLTCRLFLELKDSEVKPLVKNVLWFLSVLLFACAVVVYYRLGIEKLNLGPLFYLPCALLIFTAAMVPLRVLEWQPLVWLGNLTFYIYIGQKVVIRVFVFACDHLGLAYSNIPAVVACLALLVAVSWVVRKMMKARSAS